MAAPMFNVFVGSETGLLKGINLVKDTWSNLNEVSKPDKANEIRSLTWVDENEEEICVGLRNKSGANFDIANQTLSDFVSYDAGPGDLRDLFRHDNSTVTALDSGLVNVWRDQESVHQIETCTLKDSKLSCMVHNKFDTTVIGTGGKESDLKLWDMNNPENPTFHAKNLKNDWLNLRVPIWVTGIGFLSDKKVVTSTGYHQVRVYDPSVQRRPVLDMTWDEYPITAMSIFNENQVIVGNTHGSMALLDIRKGSMVNRFKGFAGSIRSIKCHPSQPVVASCGLDRFFRVHDINSKQLLHKKYMKSRLNCVLLSKGEWVETDTHSKDTVVDSVENEDESSEDVESNEPDDDIWEQFEVVKTRTVKRKEADVDTDEDSSVKKQQKLTKQKVVKKKARKSKGRN